MFKKTAIAALVLGFSGAASAAMYAPAPAPACAAGNVTVPCERNAWDLGVDALYFRAEENRFSGNDGYRADYGWGFRVEGSYHWGTGNDININWAHYKKTTNNVVVGNLRNQFDIVNAEFGQHVDFGENVDIRFHGGVQFAELDDDIVTAAPATTWTVQAWGPRIGADSSYNFGNGFAIFANGAVSVQTQRMKANTAGVATSYYGTGVANEAKLGASYTHPMAQGDLTLRAAWEVHNYTNAGAAVAAAAGFAGADLGWNGVSFGLKWVGNA